MRNVKKERFGLRKKVKKPGVPVLDLSKLVTKEGFQKFLNNMEHLESSEMLTIQTAFEILSKEDLALSMLSLNAKSFSINGKIVGIWEFTHETMFWKKGDIEEKEEGYDFTNYYFGY